jgi:hypothetical protein
MSVQIETEQATVEEAAAILLERMPLSKVARLLSAWQVGHGDHLVQREKLFAGETVDSLFQKTKSVN